MKISSKTHYGVQVCCLLATEEGTLSAKELEKRIAVSSKYLEKILKILSGIGVVKATRGANGGYALTREPENIYMGNIVRALEEDNLEIIGCVAKNDCCCPSAKLWKKLFDGMNEILDKITLKDVADGDLGDKQTEFIK